MQWRLAAATIGVLLASASTAKAQGEIIDKPAAVYFDKQIPQKLRTVGLHAIQHLAQPQYGLRFNIIKQAELDSVPVLRAHYADTATRFKAFPELREDSIEVIVFGRDMFADSVSLNDKQPDKKTFLKVGIGYVLEGKTPLFVSLLPQDSVLKVASTVAHEHGHKKGLPHSMINSVMYSTEFNHIDQLRGFTPTERARLFTKNNHAPYVSQKKRPALEDLTQPQYLKIVQLYSEGNNLYFRGDHFDAWNKYGEALALNPDEQTGNELLDARIYLERTFRRIVKSTGHLR